MTFSPTEQPTSRIAVASSITKDVIAARIEGFIRQRFHVPADDPRFSRTSHLWEEGYIDSTGVMELVAFLENEFEMVLPDDALFDPSFSHIDGMAGIVGACMQQRERCSNDCATTTHATEPA